MQKYVLVFFAIACGNPEPGSDAPTWRADVASVVVERCAGCHTDGDIAPFPLTTYEEVSAVSGLVASVIEAGTMPPWQPDNACRDYQGDLSMSDEERALVLAWVDGGTPEGGAGDEPTVEAAERGDLDLTLFMSEPYTPRISPDDYRCLVLEWPETEPRYVTAYEVFPDARAQVHHVLAYMGSPADADQFRAWDAGEEGPGYTCYGDTSGPGGSARSPLLGGWVPGVRTPSYPEGTGILVEPGSVIVLQVHYNTATADPVPDQTYVSFDLADSVEREAVSSLFTDALWTLGSGMNIPAGAASVTHDTLIDVPFFLGISGSGFEVGTDESLDLHSVGLHMHQLGKRGRVSLVKADGSEECLLDIPRWDFNWQGRYRLTETVTIAPGDQIRLECEWDNSAANAVDTWWGDGTGDEMCLSGMYLSRM
jgi:hypothetical protein